MAFANSAGKEMKKKNKQTNKVKKGRSLNRIDDHAEHLIRAKAFFYSSGHKKKLRFPGEKMGDRQRKLHLHEPL